MHFRCKRQSSAHAWCASIVIRNKKTGEMLADDDARKTLKLTKVSSFRLLALGLQSRCSFCKRRSFPTLSYCLLISGCEDRPDSVP